MKLALKNILVIGKCCPFTSFLFLTILIKNYHSQLYNMQNKIGNMLRAYGVNKGDCVSIYLPTSPIAVACMLACARIGVSFSLLFENVK